MIRLDEVYKAFGSNQVLTGASLVVKKGESRVVIGGSGSGKSVILKHIVGIMKPDKGSYVEVDGIHEQNATWIKIHLENPSPAHTDGELFTRAIQDLEYSIFPERLLILMS